MKIEKRATKIMGMWLKNLVEFPDPEMRRTGIAMLMMLTDVVEAGWLKRFYAEAEKTLEDIDGDFQLLKKIFEEVGE